jgi:hypothetical protein
MYSRGKSEIGKFDDGRERWYSYEVHEIGRIAIKEAGAMVEMKDRKVVVGFPHLMAGICECCAQADTWVYPVEIATSTTPVYTKLCCNCLHPVNRIKALEMAFSSAETMAKVTGACNK